MYATHITHIADIMQIALAIAITIVYNISTTTERGNIMNATTTLVTRSNSLQTAHISADLFQSWTAFIDASPKTVETYNRAIRQFANYLQAECIAAPCKDDIIAFRKHIAATRKPSTANSYLMAVKQFFKWTEERGLYPNIAKNVKAERIAPGHKRDAITRQQAQEMLNNIDLATEKGKRDYAILVTMLTGGLRGIEIERANVGDLRTISGKRVIFIQGKGHIEKDTPVILGEHAAAAIDDYMGCRGNAENDAPLFASTANRNAGGRVSTRSIRRLIKDNLIDIGANSSRLSAHSLRHYAIDTAYRTNKDIAETQQFARHASPTTTLIYVHEQEQLNNTCSCRIDAILFSKD